MSRYLIIDFYVDEPSCLGVPPYISPYVRYTAGALKFHNPDSEVDYISVDELRLVNYSIEPGIYTLIYIIAGVTVPGKYLGGKIGSAAELITFMKNNARYLGKIVAGGPISHSPTQILDSFAREGLQVVHSVELAAALYASGRDSLPGKGDLSYREISNYAQAGAFIIQKHFRYPYVIMELETYRGCTRKVHCSFCSEQFIGSVENREVDEIVDEVSTLYSLGARYFRLGKQADIFSYYADKNVVKHGFLKPSVKHLERLYHGIRKAAPQLKVLHLDNVNPGTLALFPEECNEIASIICSNNTHLDTAAMGMESADPEVIRVNHLKADAAQIKKAIAMIDRSGRQNGSLPRLTAGINLIGGLPGESENTFALNYHFLKDIYESDLLLRRINIRQISPISGSEAFMMMQQSKNPGEKRRLNKFQYFKEKIREEIDIPMLKKIFPPGTVIPNVILEKRVPGGFLGRPMGSYPITFHLWATDKFINEKIVMKNYLGPFKEVDVVVVGYKERTLYSLSLGDDLSKIPMAVWRKFVGREVAEAIWAKGLNLSSAHLPNWLQTPLKLYNLI